MVISLGGRCEVAWQIRATFGDGLAFPFDWLVTPLQSIPLMIEENFARMVEPELIEVSPYIHPFDGRKLWTIINRRYQIFLHHEFDREPDGTYSPRWRDKTPEVEAKWRFLAYRWRDMLKSTPDIVFVRRRGCFSLPDEAGLPTKQADFETVLSALRSLCPTARMIAADPGCRNSHRAIRPVAIGTPTDADWPTRDDYWQGASSKWRPVLASLWVERGSADA